MCLIADLWKHWLPTPFALYECYRTLERCPCKLEEDFATAAAIAPRCRNQAPVGQLIVPDEREPIERPEDKIMIINDSLECSRSRLIFACSALFSLFIWLVVPESFPDCVCLCPAPLSSTNSLMIIILVYSLLQSGQTLIWCTLLPSNEVICQMCTVLHFTVFTIFYGNCHWLCDVCDDAQSQHGTVHYGN